MLYEDKIKENRQAFAQKVVQISQNLGIDPNWLMVVMNSESGINHRAKNSIGCVGLIQFCKESRTALGVSAEQLLAISNVQQLDYVLRYYQLNKVRFKDATDLYLYTFYPVALIKNWSDSQTFPSNVVAANKGFDMNKDGILTVGEFRNYVRKKQALSGNLQAYWTIETEETKQKIRLGMSFLGLFLVLAGFATYYYWDKLSPKIVL